MSAAGRNNTLHKNDDTIVAVIKNANLLKNFRMHSHSILPEMMVVMAEAVMLTPMIMSACCVLRSRVVIHTGASTYAFAR